jgi:Xaa-Pro aminopeptidase
MIEQKRIPPAEYPQRFERLRSLMRERRFDGLLLGTGSNLAYFSGYPSPARSIPRPFFLLLPLEGDPVFFSHSGHKAEAMRFSWIGDVRDYSELSHVPLALVLEAVHERRLEGKALGMELGFEQSLDISYLELTRLKEGLGETRLVDASDILWRLRMIKSKNEIDCLRQACQIVSDGYVMAFSRAHEGMPERAVYKTMKTHLEEASMGDLFLAITSGKGNYDLVTKPPEDRPIQNGDMVWMDAGCTISGYWSDFSRAGVVGKPSPEQSRAQELVHGITWEAVRQVRPGVRASQLARFCYDRLSRVGFPITSSIGALASRIGHGVGLNITEPPHIGLHDDTALAPGMVITLEPGVATEYGTFHVEENVVVTQEGYDVISNCSRDLFLIPSSS